MNKQTAALLNLSVITVKVHRATLMRKMRCRRLVDLVRAADALNVGSPRYSLAARRRQLLEPDCSFSSPQPYAAHEIHVPFPLQPEKRTTSVGASLPSLATKSL
jgi:hypothetical protein